MSLCHPEGKSVSCGACCGLFNLKLSQLEIKKILEERTLEFQASVDFKKSYSMPSYRQSREAKEDSLPKHDEMTYNCPFLGYVDTGHKKIGCMVHPIYTGDPKSQNYSFYGASICQGYDCKNKETALTERWEAMFGEVAQDSVEYSHLASDHILRSLVEKWIVSLGFSISEGIETQKQQIMDIFRRRLRCQNQFHPTSFEIDWEPGEVKAKSTWDAIEDYLQEGKMAKETEVSEA